MTIIKWAGSAFSGFQVIWSRPFSVASWAFLLGGGLMLTSIAGVFVMTRFPHVEALWSDTRYIALLGSPVMIPIGAMLLGAIYRAVLHPTDRSFGSIRLSGREFRMMLYVTLLIVLLLANFVVPAPRAIRYPALCLVAALGAPFSLVGPALFRDGWNAALACLALGRRHWVGLATMNVITGLLYVAIQEGGMAAFQAFMSDKRSQVLDPTLEFALLTLAILAAWVFVVTVAIVLAVAPSAKAYAALTDSTRPTDDVFS